MDQPVTATSTLPAILTDRLDEVAAVCRTYGVRRLYVFGSAVLGTFDPETSDLDFMVDLGEYQPFIARRYFRLQHALQDLFGREIDLITTDSTGGKQFMKHVFETREVIYVA